MKLRQGLIISLVLILLLSGCGHIKLESDSSSTELDSAKKKKEDPGCVTLYEHSDFKGKKKTICHSNPNISYDFNDITSSVKADCSVRTFTLYQHIDYAGDTLTIKGCNEIKDLNKLNSLFNDITSSITIEHTNHKNK